MAFESSLRGTSLTVTKEAGRKSRVRIVIVFIVSLSRAARAATLFESSAMTRLMLLSLWVTRLNTYSSSVNAPRARSKDLSSKYAQGDILR